jgi:hypothetical protein
VKYVKDVGTRFSVSKGVLVEYDDLQGMFHDLFNVRVGRGQFDKRAFCHSLTRSGRELFQLVYPKQTD